MGAALGASGFSRPASRPTSPPSQRLYGGAGASNGGYMATSAYDRPQAQATETVVDGKQFFRQARSHLSYEAFNEFLASIKNLNNQSQTRQQTLDEARQIFG